MYISCDPFALSLISIDAWYNVPPKMCYIQFGPTVVQNSGGNKKGKFPCNCVPNNSQICIQYADCAAITAN